MLSDLHNNKFKSSFSFGRRGQGAENELQFLTLNGREILETVKQNTRQRTRLIDESPRSTPVNDDRDATESSSSFGGFNDSRSRSCSGRSQTARSEVSTTSTVHSEKYSDELSNESESDGTLRDQPLTAALLVH